MRRLFSSFHSVFSPRLRAQIVKEMLSVLRDPKSRLVLIVPPLMQLFVFSFAATLEVKNVDIAVLDRDGGRASYELVARIASARFVRTVRTVESREAAARLVESRDAIAWVSIPADFSRDIAAHRPATVQIVVDGRRANAGQVTLGYLQSIATTLGAEVTGASTRSGDVAAVRHWFNPSLEYRWFVVPSLAGMLAMLSSLIVTALSIARERELGTFDQLLVSPTTPIEIVIAKTVPALVIGTMLGSPMIGAGVVIFGIPFTGSFALLLPCLMLFILSVVGIGLAISSVCATQQQAILGTFALAVPMILMSGFATPVENMPVALQWIAEAIPIKHFLILVQGSFLKALPAREMFAHAWPIAVIAAFTFIAATVFVRGRLQ